MSINKRTTRHIPGIEPEAEIALNRVIDQLTARLEALESKPIQLPTQRSNFVASEGQTIAVEPPSGGMSCTIVQATRFNRGARITFVQKNASSVTFRAVSGTVNGVPFVISNTRGTYEAISDGEGGWSLNQGITSAGVIGAPGTPGTIGPTGPMGFSGQDGEQGERGDQGFPGAPGAPGATGPAGATGPMGFSGQDGADGNDGFPGVPGAPGAAGATGASGATPPVAGLVLSATTQSIQIVTTTTATTHFEESHNSLSAGVTTPGSNTGSITSAATTTAVGAPGPSTQVTVVELTIINVDAVLTQFVTVQKDISGTPRALLSGITLNPGERIEFTADMGWRVFDSQGRERKNSVGGLVSGNAITVGAAVDLTGSTSTININPTAGALGVVDISLLQCGGVLTFQGVTEATIDGFTAKTDGFFFFCHNRDATTAAVIKILEDSGSTTTSVRTPDIRDLRLYKNDCVALVYSNSRWRSVAVMPRLFLTGVETVTWAAQENDHARPSAGQNHIRVTLTGGQTLTGLVPDSSPNGSPNGEICVITNIDTVDTLTIAQASASSAAANRFNLPNQLSITLPPQTCAAFHYDDTSSRWRLLGSPPDFSGKLLRTTTYRTGTVATHTYLTNARFVDIEQGGAGAGAGGVDGQAGASNDGASSGGGAGCYDRGFFAGGSTGGSNASGPCSGGGGASSNNNNTNVAGGDGDNGIVVYREYS